MTERARVLTLIALAALSATARADDWPQFRGPKQNGVARSGSFRLMRPPTIAWKTALPGAGWSQPIIVGNTVYVTTAVAEAPLVPKSLTAGPADPASRSRDVPPVPDTTIDWRLIAVDLASGDIRWSRSVAAGKPQYPVHPSNTYATETPAADGQAVYALFGMCGVLAACDHEGNELWRRELGAGPVDQGHGTASSLAIDGDRLFVPLFRDDAARLICVDARSGSTLWQAEREQPATAWSTPIVWKHGAGGEVVMGAKRLTIGYDTQTGVERWRISGVDAPHKASPVATTDAIIFGYRMLHGTGALYALDAPLVGHLSPPADKRTLEASRWSAPNAAASLASPLVVGGRVYSIGGSVLTCLDEHSGDVVYRQRLPDMNTVTASPVVIDEVILIADEDGKLLFLKRGPTFKVVARLDLAEMLWSSPAFASDRLLVRTVDHLYCLEAR